MIVPHKMVSLERLSGYRGFTICTYMSAMCSTVDFLCISTGVKRYIKPDPVKSNGSACD